jgi:GT2 family glycosyltransferase
MDGVARFWEKLGAAPRRRLVLGSVGADQLLALAGLTSNGAPGLALDVLAAAWADSPLDGALAQTLAATSSRLRRPLPLPVADLLKAQANFWKPAGADDPWRSATGGQRGDILASRLRQAPRNLFWKLAAWDAAWPDADWALAEAVLEEGGWPRTLAPLRHRFAAMARLCMGDAHAALAELNAAAPLDRFIDGAPLRATCLLRMGRRDEAAQVLRDCVLRAPWRVNELLRLSDLVCGADEDARPVPGSCAILLYSFNKATELDQTLASLAASELSGAPIFALDNGSTDATPRVLAQWRERLDGRLSVVTLPVNIGAPAARNWLLALPELRGFEYLAFVDDDVSLPTDWLSRLGAAALRLPEASVWGCRVVEEACPLVVQNVDYTPLAPQPGEQLLVLANLHRGAPDLGRFDYLRPCVSVTGCCHLLRAADIPRVGGFDIRFSPSQYDDLERDLRVFLAGGHAAYQGHLAVRHKRRSGAQAQRSAAEIGGATANAHKLQTKHTLEDFRTLHERGAELLERDFLRRIAAL